MLFKLSNLNSNLTLTLGYFNPALNNSALVIIPNSYQSPAYKPSITEQKFYPGHKLPCLEDHLHVSV